MGVLTGFERKVLYEGGQYNQVFVNRLSRITTYLAQIETAGQNVLSFSNARQKKYKP